MVLWGVGLTEKLSWLCRLVLLCLGLVGSVQAEQFAVRDIRVDGLQRIAAGTVFNYLPLRPGDPFDTDRSSELLRAIYGTGFFKDVRLEREGDVLVVVVQERPAIASIAITGNKSIKEEELKQGLSDIGMAEGRTFNRSVLDKIEQELKRQYFNQGKYGVRLTTEVTPLERNRVAISIQIAEGETARIRGVNIVGNKTFEEDDLLDDFESRVGGWLAFFTKEDQYSRQKLAGDLERLRSYYLDRGYINFSVDSTQVAISPDKKDIFITINVTEGDLYRINDIKLAGKMVISEQELFPMIHLRRGEPFSRKEVVGSSDRINDLLSNAGYAFANVNSIPEVDEANKTVAVTYFLDPGKRVYLRRLEIEGNSRTRDRVVRREMRQQEKAWLSSARLKLSRERLMRLGYFEEVNIETPAVPGSSDEVDVKVKVKEKPSGAFTGGLGYSKTAGVTIASSIREDNFLGTGKRVDLAFNNSNYATTYRLSYLNPYSTVNGVSRGFNLSYQKTDFSDLDVSDYRTDVAEASVNYGIPLTEFNRFNMGFAVQDISLKLGNVPSLELLDFVDRYGTDYLNFKLSARWNHDSRDSAIFPTAGITQRFEADITVPGSDLEFYKLFYSYRQYVPLTQDLTFSFRGDLGYGDGYLDTEDLPIFEHFFAGGERSLRGFKTNSLGPRDSLDDPLGGNVEVTGSLELLMPPPFDELRDTLRVGTFLDFGNVYLNEVDFGEFRYSAGIGATWLSPLGIMSLSYGIPLNEKDGDDVEEFQFSFGSAF